MKIRTFLLCPFLIFGCSPKDLEFKLSSSDKISGSIANFSSLSSSQLGALSSCAGEKVNLFSIHEDGTKSQFLLSGEVDENGHYSLKDLQANGVEFSDRDLDSTRLLLEFSCGTSLYQRFVTGFTNQDLNEGASLLSWLSQTDSRSLIPLQRAELWESFYNHLLKTDSMTEAFSTLSSNVLLKNKFESAFGIPVSDLLLATPHVRSIQVPNSFHEGEEHSLSVQSIHWSADYNQAYSWRIGSDVLSQSSHFNFIPHGNAQGEYTLQLFIGQNDGSGQVDTSKPYIQRTFDISISNEIPATPPVLSRTSALYTNSALVNLEMNTGVVIDGRALNCKSFSKLALTEDDVPATGIAPLLYSSYDIDCTQSPTQDLNFTLSGTEGPRTIRLWAMDAAGNRSTLSSDVSVIYDVTDPEITLTSFNSSEVLRGGDQHSITYEISELNIASNSLDIEYSSDNGMSWTAIATNASPTGSHLWTLPTINSSQVLIRIHTEDLAGNTGSVTSASSFTIDSISPTAPVIERTSNEVSNDRTVALSVTCVSDYDQVYLSESSTSPGVDDEAWQPCSSSMNFEVSAGDGLKSIHIWSKDLAGNVSPTSNAVTMSLDQTAPIFEISSDLSGFKKGGSEESLTWSSSESHPGESVDMLYSLNNGVSWISLLTEAPNNGSALFSYPTENSSEFLIKIRGCDQAENCGEVVSAPLVLDSIPPVISNFQLASGATATAFPTVTALLQVSDLNGASHMRLSEIASYQDDNWQEYFEEFNHSLSMTNGEKTVYVWVKDKAGNVSTVSSYDISLDFGVPPNVQVTGPTPRVFGSGEIVSIEWTCTGESPLAANPISIEYTKDDSESFVEIVKDIPNSGQYDWPLPSDLVGIPFRIKVSCSSQADVVTSSFSKFLNTSNWNVFMGDPSYNLKGVNVMVADVSTSSQITLTSDKKNNIYFVKDHAVMKVDALSGVLNPYLGKTDSWGCTFTEGGSLDGLMNSPRIIGTNVDKSGIFVYTCEKVFLVNTQTHQITLWWNASPTIGQFFLTPSQTLIFHNSRKIYKLDLSEPHQVAEHIHGTGGCVRGQPSTGPDARLIDIPDQYLAPPLSNCGNVTLIFANNDASKIWLNIYHQPKGYRLDLNGDKYEINQNDTGWNRSSLRGCVTLHSRYIVCGNPYGRAILYFDLQTETWHGGTTVPFPDNDNSGRLSVGVYGSQLVVHYSLGHLYFVNPVFGGTWESTIFGGQSLATVGNGESKDKVAFLYPNGMRYSPNTQKLYVRSSTRHMRIVDFSDNHSTTTHYGSGSGNYPTIAINKLGDRLGLNSWCGIGLWNIESAFSSLGPVFSGACNSATTYPYPPPSDVPAVGGGAYIAGLHALLIHSNGLTYWTYQVGSNDVFVWSSDGVTLSRVAGREGPGGYNEADDGGPALGAYLSNVQHLHERSDGKILMWDRTKLRLLDPYADPVTIDTLFDYADIPGYSDNGAWGDVHYDEASGWTYYVRGANVRKIKPGEPIHTYDFTGTTLSGNVRITLTPAGLLVLQPNKSRILVVDP